MIILITGHKMEFMLTLFTLHLSMVYSQLPIRINPFLARALGNNPFIARPIARQLSARTCNVATFIMQPAFDIRRFMGAWYVLYIQDGFIVLFKQNISFAHFQTG